MAGGAIFVTGAVEGDLDEAVLRRIVEHVGASLTKVLGRHGKQALLQSIAGYNNAARFEPWIVLVDLDQDCDCAPPCQLEWLPAPAQHMCFRIAVRAVEAWLLSDRDRIANFLKVPVARVPEMPESLGDPKRELVDLARRSSRRAVREELVPALGSGRQVGPLYIARLIHFVEDQTVGWRPSAASRLSDSLARCIACLDRLIGGPA